jgi:hypothetical protein
MSRLDQNTKIHGNNMIVTYYIAQETSMFSNTFSLGNILIIIIMLVILYYFFSDMIYTYLAKWKVQQVQYNYSEVADNLKKCREDLHKLKDCNLVEVCEKQLNKHITYCEKQYAKITDRQTIQNNSKKK